MDKRMLVALALTVVVIMVFQFLFPGTATRRRSFTRPDSVAASATSPSSDSAVAPAPTPALAAAPAATPALPSAPSPVAVPPETLAVKTSHADFQMTNIGAAPLGVTMLDYHATRPGDETALVDVGRPGAPLLRYRVITASDTLDLSRVPFHGTRTTTPDGRTVLTYTADVRNTPVSISYTFAPDGYTATVAGDVHGVPNGYVLIDLPNGFTSAEADTLGDQRRLAYAYKRVHQDPQSQLFAKLKPDEPQFEKGPLNWIAAQNKYFVVGLLAPRDSSAAFDGVQLVGVRPTPPSKTATLASATGVQSLKNGTFGFQLYAGPQEWRRLQALGNDFEDVNPYGGYFHAIVQPFATLIMRIILWMRVHLKLNYGWVIIVFGIAIRVLLWPLNQRAMRTSLKMQALQPELQAVQTRYKSDPQKLQTEMMKLYREHGMSPLSPLAGCLPMLIPLPILFTLLFVFQNTIEFRGVPFLWLHDISVRDPYYVLPLFMGVTAYIVSWISMRNQPPNPQTKAMSYMFPVMMTFFFLKVSAGLNLYYAVQNLATLPQQWLLANERAKAAAKT
jgi:YidC/Oxa1 family membrane protein insertase